MGNPSRSENEKALRFYDRASEVLMVKLMRANQLITLDIAKEGSLRAPLGVTGFLRASVKAGAPQLVQQGGQALIKGWVGDYMVYAAVQHENTKFKHPRGGEDHYLTKPMMEKKDQYQAIIKAAIVEAMRQARTEL